MCFFRECFPSARKCVLLWSVLPLHQHVFDLGTIFFCTVMCAFWERSSSAPTCAYPGNDIPLQQRWFLQAIVSASPLYQFICFFWERLPSASTCASSGDALALRQRFVSCETPERPSSAPLCVASGHDPFLWGRNSFAPTCVSSGHEFPLHQHVFLLGTIQLPLHRHVFLLGTFSLRAKMCFIVERCPSAPTCASSGNYCRLHHHVDSGNDLHQHQLVNLLGTTSQCTPIGFFWELFPFHYFMLPLGTIFLCISRCFF